MSITTHPPLIRAAHRLGAILQDNGYDRIVGAEHVMEQLVHCDARILDHIWNYGANETSATRDLLDFAFFCQPLSVIRALDLLSEPVLDALNKLGVLHFDGDLVSLPNHMLLLHRGCSFIAPRLIGATTSMDLYLGWDSLKLASHLRTNYSDPLFEIGAGTGIIGLIGTTSSYLASEISAESTKIASFNFALNRQETRCAVVRGDLLEPLDYRARRIVAANPPYVAAPPELPLPVYSMGGADGLDMARRIVKSWNRFTNFPICVFILRAYGEYRAEKLEEFLNHCHGCADITLEYLSDTPLTEEDFMALALGSGGEGEWIMERARFFEKHYQKQGFIRQFDILATLKRI
uniref:Methyltransferase small domain-containing protein n=1 Tax=Candidatus Kentrum sp. SD TaxID=2126332 RepID=A0A450YUZ0_9GAMM|nr:MAG: Methyltransferase small domain-containing protein [Candidatus Kentron sp. SD]VFK45354.1 MAG: Methyltransferase small domain-containing protein [Candidatus Kentron sp. SD]